MGGRAEGSGRLAAARLLLSVTDRSTSTFSSSSDCLMRMEMRTELTLPSIRHFSCSLRAITTGASRSSFDRLTRHRHRNDASEQAAASQPSGAHGRSNAAHSSATRSSGPPLERRSWNDTCMQRWWRACPSSRIVAVSPSLCLSVCVCVRTAPRPPACCVARPPATQSFEC